MMQRDEAMVFVTANPEHDVAKHLELERQQSELLARLNAFIEALGRVDACFETTPDPDEVMRTLGKELKRLGLDCMIATLETEAQPLVIRYLSINSKTLALIEELVGVKALGFRIPRERFAIYDHLVQHQRPVYVTDWLSLIAPLLPGVSQSALEQAGKLAGVTPDTQAACLPMQVGEWVQGVMNVWGEDLCESDLPALSVFASQAAIALENARLLTQVRILRERLRRLVVRLVSAQEEERQRMSRELHDEAGQALTALKISLELIQADLPTELEPFRHRLGEAAALVEQTLEQIHWLTQDLRPPILDAIGLNRTLESYCRDFAQRTRLSIAYHGLELGELPGAVSISFYRFLQEALTNVAKHAHAQHVQVVLGNGADTVSLTVQDDGQGFDPNARLLTSGKPAGLGLHGMRERFDLFGGQLQIESCLGQGTRLVACVPLSEVE